MTGFLARDASSLSSIQAEEALANGEVPVGCVFVRDGVIIGKARNRTNELRDVCFTAFHHPLHAKHLMKPC